MDDSPTQLCNIDNIDYDLETRYILGRVRLHTGTI